MDGTSCGEFWGSYTYFINFTWDRSNAPSIVPASPGGLLSTMGGNNINYDDPLESGLIGTPEPATVGLFITAVALCAVLRRTWRRGITQS
jgi:hypothetical protein